MCVNHPTYDQYCIVLIIKHVSNNKILYRVIFFTLNRPTVSWVGNNNAIIPTRYYVCKSNKNSAYKKKLHQITGILKIRKSIGALNEMTECNKIMIHRVKYFYE